MRNKFLLILALPFLFSACKKSSTCPYTASQAVAPAAEVASLKTVIGADTSTYTQHSSGFFYKITNPGTGATPSVCSYVTVKYVGRLTNGTVFDESNTSYPNGIAFTLGELIAGWKIGIPLIKKGGSIILYIPPSLGYGAQASYDRNGNVVIPANSNLVFTIELVEVQ